MLGIVTEDDDGEGARVSPQAARPLRSAQKVSTKTTQERPAEKPRSTQSPVGSRNGLNLPHIEGIQFQTVPVQDGRTCIVAAGDTVSKKIQLMEAGFTWNPQRKIWWKYAA